MEMVLFVVVAIALYFISDQVVNLIEKKRGERFQNRTLLFFAIIFTLTMITFNAIEYYKQGTPSEKNTAPVPATTNSESKTK